MTKVNEVMTRDVMTLAPSDTLIKAAQAMDELNVGVIPVCEGGKLMGMVTDRDIVVRGLARSLDSQTATLSDVMSTSVRTARENDDIDDVLVQMGDSQIRRVPVVDDEDRVLGIVSLGDIATKGQDEDADVGESLSQISSPAEPDRTTGS